MKTFLTSIAALLLVLSVALPAESKDNARQSKGKSQSSESKESCCKEACDKGDDCCKNKTMNKFTSFSFHQSGGFMGVDRRYEAKLADLKKEEASELEKLVNETGLLKIKDEQHMTKGAADMFVYRFSATANGAVHTVVYDDGTLPETFRPLLTFLKDRTRDMRQR